MLPEKVLLPIFFDANKLKRDLGKIEADWTAHFVKDNYEGDWSVIPLRGPKGAQHPIQMIFSSPSVKEFEDTSILKGCDYFKEVIDWFETYVTSVRLMRLGAGAKIKQHQDYDLDEDDGIVRIHIPIITSELVEFYLNRERLEMKEGECWYCRLSDPHSVYNRGTEDRIHLVLDMELNSWLKGKLQNNSVAT